MTGPDADDADDKPLDPAMERVRRKMVRTLGVSIGIMCIGLMAVLGAIVYKLSAQPDAEPSIGAEAGSGYAVPGDAPRTARAVLPEGFSVDHVGLDGNRILFFGQTVDGAVRALVFDIGAGRITADIAVGG